MSAAELQQSRSRMEALLAASLSVTGHLSQEEVLRNLVTSARDLVEAEYCALGILPEGGGPPRFVVAGLSATAEAEMNVLQSLRGLRERVLVAGQTLRLREISAHPAYRGLPAGHLPVESLLAVPISLQGAVTGGIFAAQKQGAAEFSPEDETMLTLLAGHAAAALANARLYREACRARERLEGLVQSSHDAIVLMDGEGRVELWNRGAESLYGFTATEALGSRLPFSSEEGRSDSEARLRRALEGDRVDGEEGLHRARDGRLIPVLVSHSRVDAGGAEAPRVLMIAKDLTAQKRLEFQRRRLSLLEARDRIGMDLHDGAIQELYAVGMGLEAVRRRLPDELTEIREGLAEATVNLNRVIGDLRAYILDQRPRILAGHGLKPELDSLVDRLREEGGLTVTAEIEIAVEPPPEVSGQVLHILAEALSNVLRHSRAQHVLVLCRVVPSEVLLVVRDDGVGFDPAAVESKGRLGLRNMRARAQSLGGDCQVRSAPGQGSEVCVRVPLEGEDAAWGTGRSD